MKLPNNTCPDIDKIIKSINDAMEMCDVTLDTDDVSEVQRAINILNDIEYELRDLEDLLEGLRKDNATLREAAHFYRDKFEELEQQVEDAAQERSFYD